MSDIPEWAYRRVASLTNSGLVPLNIIRENPESFKLLIAFARYIASKEEAPVDPLLLEARAIAASYYRANDDGLTRQYHSPDGGRLIGTGAEIAERYSSGKQDDRLGITLAALKRGMELAKEQSNG